MDSRNIIRTLIIVGSFFLVSQGVFTMLLMPRAIRSGDMVLPRGVTVPAFQVSACRIALLGGGLLLVVEAVALRRRRK